MLHHINSVFGIKILYSRKEIYHFYQLVLLSQDILKLHKIILISLKRIPYYSMIMCILGLFVVPELSKL